jgi:CBS domain-containing protein
MGKISREVNLMKLRDIMTTDVASLKSRDSIETAAQLMKQYDVGSIPVCDQNKIVGIVTDRDITLRSVASGQNSRQMTVSDVMTSNPVVGSPDMDIHEAAKLMSDKQIRRLPVVENNSLVGIVALGDISVEPSLQDSAGKALQNISQPSGSIS